MVISSLSSFYSVQEPSPWDYAVYSHGGSSHLRQTSLQIPSQTRSGVSLLSDSKSHLLANQPSQVALLSLAHCRRQGHFLRKEGTPESQGLC